MEFHKADSANCAEMVGHFVGSVAADAVTSAGLSAAGAVIKEEAKDLAKVVVATTAIQKFASKLKKVDKATPDIPEKELSKATPDIPEKELSKATPDIPEKELSPKFQDVKDRNDLLKKDRDLFKDESDTSRSFAREKDYYEQLEKMNFQELAQKGIVKSESGVYYIRDESGKIRAFKPASIEKMPYEKVRELQTKRAEAIVNEMKSNERHTAQVATFSAILHFAGTNTRKQTITRTLGYQNDVNERVKH